MKIQRPIGAAADHARADQRRGVHVGRREHLASLGAHVHEVAGSKRTERAAFDVDLVAEHPGMAGAQPALLAALEIQRREIHVKFPDRWRRVASVRAGFGSGAIQIARPKDSSKRASNCA